MSESQIPKKPSCTDNNKKDNNQTDNGNCSNSDSKQTVDNISEPQIQVIFRFFLLLVFHSAINLFLCIYLGR